LETGSASAISLQFLTSEFARLRKSGRLRQLWLMILRSFVRYLSHEGHVPPGLGCSAAVDCHSESNISLRRGLSRNTCARSGQPVKVGGPATFVTGRFCWSSCVSDSVPRRSPTSHLQTSIGGVGAEDPQRENHRDRVLPLGFRVWCCFAVGIRWSSNDSK